jgi:hypothetical protein
MTEMVGDRVNPIALQRLLFCAALAWGASIFWLAEHPPMVDLPAHGGQVALLHDLLLGEGRWAEIMRVNWFTPYLIGYGLALPLSLVMPVAAALKLLLSAAYVAFVVACVKLAEHFDSDPRLHPLFLVSFFGVSYHWGFFTFLVAAPLTVYFVLVAARHARNPHRRSGLALFAVGVVLLASHGLAFMLGWAVGAALLAVEWRRLPLKRLAGAALPFFALALGFLTYFIASRFTEADFKMDSDVRMDLSLFRLLKVPLLALGHGQSEDRALLLLIALGLIASPLLLGLRLRRTRRQATIPLAVTLVFLFTLPAYAFNTAFLYERFALYLLPAIAWAFPAAGSGYDRSNFSWPGRPFVAASAIALLCGFVLALFSVRSWDFGQETKAFDAALRSLAPGERALSLSFTRGSDAARHRRVYGHYAAWYQAEMNGLVDFNFAWFPPQMARFRPDRLPSITPGFEWRADSFNWIQHEGWSYRYFFTRGPVPSRIFRGAPCPPVRIFSDGSFAIYENRACR